MKKVFVIIYLMIFSGFASGQSNYGFTLKGGLNLPMGDFATYYDAGFGVYGGLFYDLNKTTRLAFNVGYNNWALDLDALNEALNNSGNPGSYDAEGPINTVPILLAVKFFWRDNENFQPYVVLEGGVYNITREFYGRYIDENGVPLPSTSKTESSTDGAFNFGVGFEYPINEVIALDVSAKFHLLLAQDVYNFGDAGYGTSYSTINFISIFAGINVFFQ